MERRTVLSAVAGLATVGTLAALPAAVADADLDINAEVVQFRLSEREQIDRLSVQVTNHSGEPLQPAFLCWCSTRMTQTPWDIADGPDELPPGETTVWTIQAPGQTCSVRLAPNFVGNVAIYQIGTERREAIQFFPKVSDAALDGRQDTCDKYNEAAE